MTTPEIRQFDAETFADLIEVVRLYRRGQLATRRMPPPRPDVQLPTPLYVHNGEGSEIPSWACMQVTGTEEIGGQNYLVVEKPADVDGSSGWYLFNGPLAIPADENGVAQPGLVVRAYKNSGTITAGEKWEPVANQWYIEQDDAGPFTATGADDIGDDVLRIFVGDGGGGTGAKIALAGSGVTARSGTTAGSGTVTEYKLSSGTLTTNTNTFTAYNLDAKAIPSNQYVLCVQEQISNEWIVQHPGIIDLRLSGNNLQYTFDGTTWVTWTTATTCA